MRRGGSPIEAGRRGARSWVRQMHERATPVGAALIAGLAAAASAEIWLPAVAGAGVSAGAALIASISGNLVANAIQSTWDSFDAGRAVGADQPQAFAQVLEETFGRLLSPDQDPSRRRAFEREIARLVTVTGAIDETGAEPDLHDRITRSLAALGDVVTTGNEFLRSQIQQGQDQVSEYARAQRAATEEFLRLEQQTRADLQLLLQHQLTGRTSAPGAGRPEPVPRLAPFPGLRAFGPKEAAAGYFHGREQTIVTLLNQLAVLTRDPTGILVVTGSSGAGKTSLLDAGLLPAVAAGLLPVEDSGRWPVLRLTPTDRPLHELAVHVANAAQVYAAGLPAQLLQEPATLRESLAQLLHRPRDRHPADPTTQRVLLVVDQAEELFTLGCPAAEREAFLTALIGAATPGGPTVGAAPQALVLLSFRADFYAHFAAQPGLAEHLERHQVVVGALGREQLREVIEKPCLRAGLRIEGELLTALLDDSTPQSLPLLAHTLRGLYERREDGLLALAQYRRMGGLAHAVAETADTLYAGLSPAGRIGLRQMMLALVSIGDGGQDTRQAVPTDELLALVGDRPDHPGPGRQVLDELIDSRLVTADRNTCFLTHEAIITAWPRLQDWLTDDRTGLRLHQELRRSAGLWRRLPTDRTLLWGGSRLEEVEAWSTRHPSALSALDRRFLRASRSYRQAQARTTRRRKRTVRIIATVLTGLLVSVTALALVSVHETRSAQTARDSVTSSYLADEAERLLSTNGPLAALLALQAHRLDPGTRTDDLLERLSRTPLDVDLSSASAGTYALAVQPDAAVIATGDMNGIVRFWNPVTGTALGGITTTFPTVESLSYNADGTVLTVGGGQGTQPLLWSTVTNTPIRSVDQGNLEYAMVAFSPSADVLAIGTYGRAILVDGESGELIRTLPVEETSARSEVTFSPDGRRIAVGHEHQIDIFDVSTGASVVTIHSEQPLTEQAPSFSPDGALVAAASSQDAQVIIWNTHSGKVYRRLPFSTGMTPWAATFSPDGATLAVPTSNSITQVDYRSGETARVLYCDGLELNWLAAFSPDGRFLVSGGDVPRVWENTTVGRIIRIPSTEQDPDAQSPLLAADLGTLVLSRTGKQNLIVDLTSPAPARSARMSGAVVTTDLSVRSPDGRFLAVLDQRSGTTHITVFDVRTAAQVSDFDLAGTDLKADYLTFDATGQYLLSPIPHKSAFEVVDTTTGRQVRRVSVSAAMDSWKRAALAPDDRTLAVLQNNGTIQIWTIPSLSSPLTVRDTARLAATLHGVEGAVADLVFSPDGAGIAAAGYGGDITLWNLTDENPAQVMSGSTEPVESVAFSPDGHLLAAASWDDALRLWNAETGAELGSYGWDFTNFPEDVFIDASGTTVGTDSSSEALLWNIAPERSGLCDRIGRDLTRTEWDTYIGGEYRQTCPSTG